MPFDAKNKTSGFTLIEVIISLVILTFVALGLMSFLISIKYAAEDNLYESTALTVALSTLEQMKSKKFGELSNSQNSSTFDLISGNGEVQSLKLNEPNDIEIPIITDETSPDNSVIKNLPLTLEPSIQPTTTNTGFWLEVKYSYDHPRNGRTRTEIVRNIRSNVQTF